MDWNLDLKTMMMVKRLGKTAGRAAVAGLVVAASAGPGRAAPIGPGFSLTAAEAGRPILLAADGRQVRAMHGLRGPSAVLPAGASPAYVAFRLDKPSELPAGYPTIQAGGRTTHDGPARGPLRLDGLAKSALDAELAKTGAVAVQLPRQTYVVESLASALGSAGAGGHLWLAPTTPAPAAHGRHPQKAEAGSVGDTLKGWLNNGANALQKVNTTISDSIKKQLQLDPPKPAIYPPLKRHTRTAAETLIPPTAADADAAVQPAPVPEPASLVVFAAAAALAALRLRPRASTKAPA